MGISRDPDVWRLKAEDLRAALTTLLNESIMFRDVVETLLMTCLSCSGGGGGLELAVIENVTMSFNESVQALMDIDIEKYRLRPLEDITVAVCSGVEPEVHLYRSTGIWLEQQILRLLEARLEFIREVRDLISTGGQHQEAALEALQKFSNTLRTTLQWSEREEEAH